MTSAPESSTPEPTIDDAPETPLETSPELAAEAAPEAPSEEAPSEPAPETLSEAAQPGPASETPSDASPSEPAPADALGAPWGRVDDDGTVSVFEDGQWRVVGQFPDGSPEEALAYFQRKFADLAGEVGLLEVRHRRGDASAADLRTTLKTVRGRLDGAAAVGDLASLGKRLSVLEGSLAEASATEAKANRAAMDAAIAERTTLVESIEAIAAKDPKSIQWKQTNVEVTALFDQWQAQQTDGPRLPKAVGQQLWKRFRDARATLDRHRREFYAGLDETHKGARDSKQRLIERAEALAPRGEDGIPAYRDLLDDWKTSGRAGKKVDDALWARFKAAGDALYGARTQREQADVEESLEKIEAKRELLTEASSIPGEKDIAKARAALTAIQRRWDEIGRVFPRDKERALDDELRKIENSVRTREESDWKSNNPETKARQSDMMRQLHDAIAKLEEGVEKARKGGNPAAIAEAEEALKARKAWLSALGG